MAFSMISMGAATDREHHYGAGTVGNEKDKNIRRWTKSDQNLPLFFVILDPNELNLPLDLIIHASTFQPTRLLVLPSSEQQALVTLYCFVTFIVPGTSSDCCYS